MPESLGKILKRIRESRHFSIEEVSERSRIPKYMVSILEEDRLNEIKSVFYAKSFVKTYAAFLGALDEPSVKEYMAKGAQQPQKKPEAVSKPVTRPREIPQIKFSIAAAYKKQILAVIIGIFVFLALSFAVSQISKFIKNASTKRQNKIAIIKREAPKKAEKEKPKGAIKDIEKEASDVKTDYIELEISASDNTWLQVIVDGELVFTGAFKKGSKDTWKAKREIKLEAGNSGAVKINVNGKPVDFSGKKGKKKEIVVTKDGIK
ncbi:MAG: DUF4115 domain-containing protein [Candidatus Omnitrophica bacterium]|nr:DUF4115 domain-containing protein [Candidatus Omnitrophota bacterium]